MIAIADLLEPILELHRHIRDRVVAAGERAALEEMAAVACDAEGDTIYALDRISEEALVDWCRERLAPRCSLVLVAEGLPGRGSMVLPAGLDEADAEIRMIVDPVDGTRGLMYQKRSAWILTGVARNRGPETHLGDIELAVQTEIPLVKQHLSDTLWAIRGQGAQSERHDRIRGTSWPIQLRPSRATTLAHGFAQIARFFPGMREELAAIDEEIIFGALGPVERGKMHCFEDQYIASAGQLYELMAGHDRFTADLRPLLEPMLAARGLALGICCHPYDLCTELIARECGVEVCDPWGAPMRAPLRLDPEIAWAGYANSRIREAIEPLLQGALRRRGLSFSTDSVDPAMHDRD